MFTLTESARDLLSKVPHQPQLGPDAGLRIARSQSDDAVFVTTLSSGPRRDDEVVDHDGARVFLGPLAARRFAHSHLDARTDAAGRIEFVVRDGS